MDNRLENLLKNKNCYFIHYASDGFYNGMTPAPRISCIGIFNNSMDVRKVFSIDTYKSKFRININQNIDARHRMYVLISPFVSKLNAFL